MVDRFKRFSYLITETYRSMRKIENDVMGKTGLKGSYAVYLLALHRASGKMTAAKLADACGKNKADVSRAVADMTERGLVKRNSSKNNYRTPIVLTDLGLAHAVNLERTVELAINHVSSEIPNNSIVNFYNTIEIICANLKSISENGLEVNGVTPFNDVSSPQDSEKI